MNARSLAAGTVGALALAVGAVWAFGASRPAHHVAAVSRTIQASPGVVWGRVSGFDTQERWRSSVDDVRRVGDRVEERAWGDVLALRIVEEQPEVKLVTEIVDQTSFSGTWTITLAPEGSGTRVVVVERGEIPGAFTRALAAWFMDPEASAEQYLTDLEAAVLDPAAAAPITQPPSVPPGPPTVQGLLAAVEEIAAAWRADRSHLALPRSPPGFEVWSDDGVPTLIPRGEVQLAQVLTALDQRPKAHNPGLAQYVDGSLAPLDAAGQPVRGGPVVLALDADLLIFVSPRTSDPARLGALAVARP